MPGPVFALEAPFAAPPLFPPLPFEFGVGEGNGGGRVFVPEPTDRCCPGGRCFPVYVRGAELFTGFSLIRECRGGVFDDVEVEVDISCPYTIGG